MRGPIWNDGRVGVTGEPVAKEYSETHPNVQQYTDENGVLRTRILSKDDAPLPKFASLQ